MKDGKKSRDQKKYFGVLKSTLMLWAKGMYDFGLKYFFFCNAFTIINKEYFLKIYLKRDNTSLKDILFYLRNICCDLVLSAIKLWNLNFWLKFKLGFDIIKIISRKKNVLFKIPKCISLVNYWRKLYKTILV